MMRRTAVVLLAVTPFAGAARADAPAHDPRTSPPRAAPPADLRLGVAMGGGSELAVGMTAVGRWRWVEMGALAEGGIVLLGHSVETYGVMFGPALRLESGFHADLLGVGGAHAWSGVGAMFMSNDPGAGATLPFAGARAGVGWVFAPGASQHFELMVRAFYEHDLEHENVRYSYLETSWFGMTATEETATREVGGNRYGVVLDLGWVLDL